MIEDIVDRTLAPAMDHEWKAGLEEVLRHGTAHQAKSDESDSVSHGGEYIDSTRRRAAPLRDVHGSSTRRAT